MIKYYYNCYTIRLKNLTGWKKNTGKSSKNRDIMYLVLDTVINTFFQYIFS